MAVDLGGSAAEEAMEERGYGRMGVFEEAAEAAEAAEDAEDAVGNAVQHGNAHNRTKQSNTECNRVQQSAAEEDISRQQSTGRLGCTYYILYRYLPGDNWQRTGYK